MNKSDDQIFTLDNLVPFLDLGRASSLKSNSRFLTSSIQPLHLPLLLGSHTYRHMLPRSSPRDLFPSPSSSEQSRGVWVFLLNTVSFYIKCMSACSVSSTIVWFALNCLVYICCSFVGIRANHSHNVYGLLHLIKFAETNVILFGCYSSSASALVLPFFSCFSDLIVDWVCYGVVGGVLMR